VEKIKILKTRSVFISSHIYIYIYENRLGFHNIMFEPMLVGWFDIWIAGDWTPTKDGGCGLVKGM